MVTVFTLQKFEELVNFANRSSFPLIWDPRLRKLTISHTNYAISVAMQFFLYAGTVIVLALTIHNKGSSHFNFLLLSFYCVLGMSFGTSVLTFRTRDVARIWNSSIVFGQNLIANWWPEPTSMAEITFNRAFLQATIPANIILNLLPVFSVGHILIDHRHSVHIPNLLPHGTLIYWVTYLLYTIPYIYALFYFVCRIKIMISATTLQLMLVFPLLRQELRLGQDASRLVNRKYPCVSEFLKCPENIVVVYRSLQIIMTDMCYTFGLAIPPIQAVLGQVVISTAYLLISGGKDGANPRSRMTMVILFGTIPFCIASWTIMLTCAGMMYKSATDCILSWKTGWAHWDCSIHGHSLIEYKLELIVEL
ncbi:hypothetical protein Fcan01_10083 [Folsomia candida]|uniref:Uncharacterized protein n=1 Tax=Folsomia candida TaxID=158441 RepID=A0A226EB31_FOLCA|nr:hypothetical protein Fcan01_10083 [Folsomia candida]